MDRSQQGFSGARLRRRSGVILSPILFVSKDDPPTLLIHGDADKLVPILHSQRLHAALKDAGVTTDFVTIPGGTHGFTNPEHSRQATELMVAWFERYLLKK
jgi:dipeptidyl aminopeptidase/acylaminoacyl peptidase